MLLSELKHHFDSAPDFNSSNGLSNVHQKWLAKAVVLVTRWNSSEGALLQSQVYSIAKQFSPGQVSGIYTRISAAIADLELHITADSSAVFAAGAVYDFFRAFREQILSAERSLLIVDPYMNADAFHKYFHEVSPSVEVHLLVKTNRDGTPNQYMPALKGAVSDFNSTYKTSIEIRQSSGLHDRAVILESDTVWVIGQSIKDAARTSPTYLIRLEGDIAKLKREHYTRIWEDAGNIIRPASDPGLLKNLSQLRCQSG